MNHEQFAEGAHEWAALYAAGALTAEEQTAFAAHLAAGCPDCQAELQQFEPVIIAFAGALEPVTPAPETWASLRRRIEEKNQPASSPLRRQVEESVTPGERSQALVLRRAADAAWETTAVPGVSVRVLFSDSELNHFTALVRMAPGVSYPRHVHRGPEECLVLEGDLHVSDTILGPGDYQRVPVGSCHGVQRTEQGCLLLITSSLTDEFF